MFETNDNDVEKMLEKINGTLSEAFKTSLLDG